MVAIVNVQQAKTHFSRLLERAHSGEEIILAKAGKPYAKLVPLGDATLPRRQPGGWPEMAAVPDSVWFDPLSDDELALWEDRGSDE